MYGCTLICLVSAVLYVLYLFIAPHNVFFDGVVTNICVEISFILELIVLPLAIYYGAYQIEDTAILSSTLVYYAAANRCLQFDLVFFLCILLGYMGLPDFGVSFYLTVAFVEWTGTVSVTISLFLVTIDARACVELLRSLCAHADSDTLTMGMVREAEAVI